MTENAKHAIGLGCMRLSTASDRDDSGSIAVIHAALDAGATLLDTSDAYARDDREIGHNERLIAEALRAWTGDRATITVATKGGLKRPKGAWVNDGRAKSLRDACDASRRALGVETIDLYQLHAVDPKTPIETSVRALAGLRDEGKIRDIGLCNVTVGDIRAAQQIVDITAVQVSLSPFDDESLRNGVAEYCRDNGIRLIAYRPLGGEKVKKLARDPALKAIASKHGATVEQVVLAWLMSFDADVVPIPGATRVDTARSLAGVVSISLDDNDRHALDERFSGRMLRVPRARRRPADGADGDVVMVMGMPGAGKTTAIADLIDRGYERLNRDEAGGSLADLLPRLDELLASGHRRVVLDNTYPTRKQRNEVIEAAWMRGAPVRCIWLATSVADAQINSITRMLDVNDGVLPSPEEIKKRGKSDTRYLGPDAQFRYERTLEPPTKDEGFESIDLRSFERAASDAPNRAVFFDFDALVAGDRARIAEYHANGWLIFAHAWRPDIARGALTLDDVERSFTSARNTYRIDIHIACCPHDAGPPVCWCRKPIPGSALEFARRHDVALDRSIVVASSAADRTMGERLRATVVDVDEFFSSGHAASDT